MWNVLTDNIALGDRRALSRAISLVENEVEGYDLFLRSLPYHAQISVTGITGPPGAGKSTIADLLIGHWVQMGQSVAVLCIDPSSAFTQGALLGDRIRMREWYNHPSVFIRSFSTRGMLGGLNPGLIEVTDVVKAAGFDRLLIETVGVGQTEISIAALADTTIVVQVPEGGDDIQTMKAGLMEIADIFVINKCDRPGADLFTKNLRQALPPGSAAAVIGMTATERQGTEALAAAITHHHEQLNHKPGKRAELLAEKAFQLLMKKKMRSIDRQLLLSSIEKNYQGEKFSLYQLIDAFG